MLLLQIQLQTQSDTAFGPFEAPFKGGMLHGLVEAALTRHSPSLWASLRGPANHRPRYALRVPQDSAAHWPAGHCFELGVLLYAPVQPLWADVLAALTQGPPLALCQPQHPITIAARQGHMDYSGHIPAPALQSVNAHGLVYGIKVITPTFIRPSSVCGKLRTKPALFY